MQLSETYYQEIKNWCETHTPKVRYSYAVPLLGEGGTCSLFGELDEKPFNLEAVLSEAQRPLVTESQKISDWIQANTEIDWFGIYLKVAEGEDSSLTKLAYYGEPSRAQFPLTEAFASISNNTAVGLSGEKRVINDVQSYVTEGGEYYTCDPKVKSELCYPIISTKNNNSKQHDPEILGIIDAESFSTHCFDNEKLALFDAVCTLLSEIITKSENI